MEDEAGVQISQNPSYGWRPTNGRDTVPIGFSKKSVRLIGIIEIMRNPSKPHTAIDTRQSSCKV